MGNDPERVSIHRADGPVALTGLISRAYGRAHLECRGDQHWMRITQIRLHNARLDRVTSRTTCALTLEPPEEWHVGRVEGGRLTITTAGHQRIYGPGQIYLIRPGQAVHVAMDHPHLDVAVLRPALVSEVSAGAAFGPPGYPAGVPTLEASAAWLRTFNYVRKTVVADHTTAPPPLVVDALERLLVATTLALWPRTAQEESTARGARDGYPETLRRAMTFIESSPAEELSIEDIADAAGVTVRAVQLAFRRHLDTTPMAHLRQVRLACAHAELQSGDSEETVGSIARRWGFGNAGRFAAAYREAYGHAPLTTLRNLRPSG
jgi:AraC-like DNA-binding protein